MTDPAMTGFQISRSRIPSRVFVRTLSNSFNSGAGIKGFELNQTLLRYALLIDFGIIAYPWALIVLESLFPGSVSEPLIRSMVFVSVGLTLAGLTTTISGIIWNGRVTVKESSHLAGFSSLLSIATLFTVLTLVSLRDRSTFDCIPALYGLTGCTYARDLNTALLFTLLSLVIPVTILSTSFSWVHRHKKELLVSSTC